MAVPNCPNVFWAQTESRITLKVDLKDVKVINVISLH